MPKKSIRLRLQLWFGFLLAMLLAGFGATAGRLQRMAVMERIDAVLAQRVNLVNGAFRGSADKHGHPPPRDRRDHAGKDSLDFLPDMDADPFALPPDIDEPFALPPAPPEAITRQPVQLTGDVMQQFSTSNRFYYAVWGDREGILLAQSSPAVGAIPRPGTASAGVMLNYRMRGSAREAYQFTEHRDCILVGCNIAPELSRLRRFTWEVIGMALLLLGLGLGGGYFLSGVLLHSIRHISRTALRISEGNLSERIPTGDMDRELGQLADVLNATFARLDAAFARQQQFTADAAHELRTPLAVIISETQMALRRERNAEEYRDTIHACEEAAQKMRRLAESLLELARLDAGGESGPRITLDLAEILQEQVDRIRSLALLHNVQIHLDLQPARLLGQPEQIGRVFTNLLSNAIDYNKPGGEVNVSLRVADGWAVVVVADTGIGIEPDDLHHIFDRFYRTSRTRAQAEGHSGLGLAICKSILDTYGGRIEAVSDPGKGSRFTLHWPLESTPA